MRQVRHREVQGRHRRHRRRDDRLHARVIEWLPVREHGGDIKLVHVSTRSQRLLAIMRLAMVFETFDDEEEAIRSFASSR